MSKWLRTGDTVAVIAGNEKGKSGKLLSVGKKRVVVEGLNMRKKCIKPTQERPKGDVIEIEGSMHISNVSLCNDDGKPIKVRVKMDAKGGKELVYKDGSKEVVFRTIRKGK